MAKVTEMTEMPAFTSAATTQALHKGLTQAQSQPAASGPGSHLWPGRTGQQCGDVAGSLRRGAAFAI